MLILINSDYGGFSLSDAAQKYLGVKYAHVDNRTFGIEDTNMYAHRASDKLLGCVRVLGLENCSGKYSTWKIVDVPDDITWTIEEYDGNEWVAEIHRTWS